MTICLLSSRKNKSYIVTVNLGVIALLFFLAVVEWIIDCVNIMGEVKITLIDDTNELLSTKYSAALKFIFHGNAIQAMLYSYMVGCYQ